MADRDRLAALLAEMWPVGSPSVLEEPVGNGLWRKTPLPEWLADRLIAAGVGFPDARLREAAQDTLDWLEENATRIGIGLNCDMLAALRAALGEEPTP